MKREKIRGGKKKKKRGEKKIAALRKLWSQAPAEIFRRTAAPRRLPAAARGARSRRAPRPRCRRSNRCPPPARFYSPLAPPLAAAASQWQAAPPPLRPMGWRRRDAVAMRASHAGTRGHTHTHTHTHIHGQCRPALIDIRNDIYTSPTFNRDIPQSTSLPPPLTYTSSNRWIFAHRFRPQKANHSPALDKKKTDFEAHLEL